MLEKGGPETTIHPTECFATILRSVRRAMGNQPTWGSGVISARADDAIQLRTVFPRPPLSSDGVAGVL